MTFGFVIVGTPRSGTTLVQRLVGELEGVRVPPETHVLTRAAYGDLDPTTFPLRGADLDRIVDFFVRFHQQDDVTLDRGAVVEQLHGVAPSVIDLYVAIATVLAGPAEVVGEKTPSHLMWWRQLTAALPRLQVIATVRDPYAVTASNLRVPFGMDRVELLAEQWAADQDDIAAAETQLGPARCLVVRYETMVEDPDSLRQQLGAFLRRSVSPPSELGDRPPLFTAREWWKRRAAQEIALDDGQPGLSPSQRDTVAMICGGHLERLGYGSAPSRASTMATALRLGPAPHLRRLRYRVARSRRQRVIARFGAATS